MKRWRLGIDLGSSSLGWVAVALSDDGDPTALIDWGVRIFPDGRESAAENKIGASLAVVRREARGMRRNRDRRQLRVRECSRLLHEFGLVPDITISPYFARSKAVNQEVNGGTLARALLHICKRRGFLSNRKADGGDSEDTQRKKEMGALKRYLQEKSITLGQFLYERIQMGKSIRFRGTPPVTVLLDSEDHAAYPTRAMYMDEFITIRKMQGSTILTDEQWDRIATAIFFQRPLKAQEPGKCTFEDAPRASKHLLLSQEFRIVQEVNNLRYNADGTSHDLTQEQREKLYILLSSQKEVKFSRMRTVLKLGRESYFNLESERRKTLQGNETAALMRKKWNTHHADWDVLDSTTQKTIVHTILTTNTYEEIVQANVDHKWGFTSELLEDLHNTHFSSSFTSLSEMAMQKMLPHLRQGKQYWEAAVAVYGGHTAESFETGEVFEELPYYGKVLPKSTAPIRNTPGADPDELEYGRIPNPSVHVALNQLRQVVNALLVRLGNPYEIHIELARDLKNSAKKRADIEKEIAKATKERNENKKLLEKCGITQCSAEDLIKVRLWKELAEAPVSDGTGGMARIDIFTGKTISLRQCMSDEVEVEHLLPFSRTYDDTMANKSITFRQVNKEKGNSTPAEYLYRKGRDAYEAALQRAQKQLKASKRWRFQSDAMEIFQRAAERSLSKEEKEQYFEGADGAFIARQLKDTQYMARIAAQYLVPAVGTTHRVIPVNGRVTALLRGKWRLNFAKEKGTRQERSDHRHHAVDALIVALTSRGIIKRIATASQEMQEKNQAYGAKLYVPMPDWLAQAKRGELFEKYGRIKVSYRQDHTCEGKFFQETAYGFLPESDPHYGQGKGKFNAVTRRAVDKLKESEVEQIRDIHLRTVLQNLFASSVYTPLEWKDKLAKLASEGVIIGKQRQFIRRLRILVLNQSIRPILSAPYKGYATDSLAFCDIWKVPKTNKQKKFQGKFEFIASYVNYIDAKTYVNDKSGLFGKYKPHPAAKHCMRLYKNDMVLVEIDGQTKLMRVAGYSTTQNKVDLRSHTEAKGEQKFYSVNIAMSQYVMRKVNITPDGKFRRR